MLTPPEDEEIYPYRRVWTSIGLESGILFLLCAVAYVAFTLIGVTLPALVTQLVNLLLALLPFGLWVALSLWRERRVPQPRQRLLTVALITALAANAVGIPFIMGVFQ